MTETQHVTEPETTAFHEAKGTHLLLTLKECSSAVLHDAQELEKLVRAAALRTGSTVLQVVTHCFEPQGITVIAVLAESHASLHTYPETQTVFWDCFTCGDVCKPELSVEVLKAGLQSASISMQLVHRE